MSVNPVRLSSRMAQSPVQTLVFEIGGAYAAGSFENIAVTSPTDAGLEITGQAAAIVDGLEVDGGTYGVLVSNSASGSVDLKNLDLDSQTSAGVFYAKDLSGDLTGSVTNSAVLRSSTEPTLTTQCR